MNRAVVSSYTARTTAFATATGITDTIILDALNTFDLGLISNNLDTKMKAVYPFLGGTSSTHKYNFMDSRDLDVAFRLSFSGGFVNSSTGITPNGINGYANCFIKPSDLGLNDFHYSIYQRTNTATVQIDMGLLNVGAGIYRFLRSKVRTILGDGESVDFTSTTSSLGFWLGSKNSASLRYANYNGSVQATNTVNSSSALDSTNPFYLFALNSGGVPAFYSDRQFAFSSIGLGLTTSEQTIFYNLVQAMQTTLSRNV